MNIKYRPRVTLEPELEEEIGIMPPDKRIALARKLERWARQLRISAFILRRDSDRPKPSPSSKAACWKKRALN